MSNQKNRLDCIYTRSGDQGFTSLGEGDRIKKHHIHIETIGTVDELNSWIGLLINEIQKNTILNEKLTHELIKIQHTLFDIGGQLAMPSHSLINDSYVDQLENSIDYFNKDLPPLKNFILPGGSQATCYCHLARSVARRAERNAFLAVDHGVNINTSTLKYLNRLSDFLFILARVCIVDSKNEVLWQPSYR